MNNINERQSAHTPDRERTSQQEQDGITPAPEQTPGQGLCGTPCSDSSVPSYTDRPFRVTDRLAVRVDKVIYVSGPIYGTQGEYLVHVEGVGALQVEAAEAARLMAVIQSQNPGCFPT